MTAPDQGTAPSLDPAGTPQPGVASFAARAASVPGLGVDVAATLAWMPAAASDLPLPGSGATAARWEMLAGVAALDVGAARILEPHADALAILAEARDDGALPAEEEPEATWGVYAAEGPGLRLSATRRPDGSWRLSGTKPWCSLAAHLDRALVTAWTDPTQRGLFAVDLTATGVTARPGPWVPRGLAQVVSAPVDFDDVAARPVGGPGWYLRRVGFAWGGLGVAAVWWGAALPLLDALRARAGAPGADQVAAVLAGRGIQAAWRSRAALAEAAGLVDAAHPEPARLAGVVRAVVHDDARLLRDLAVTGLGPGPLTADEGFARRVADLEVYLGQHHGDRDLARLAVR